MGKWRYALGYPDISSPAICPFTYNIYTRGWGYGYKCEDYKCDLSLSLRLGLSAGGQMFYIQAAAVAVNVEDAGPNNDFQRRLDRAGKQLQQQQQP